MNSFNFVDNFLRFVTEAHVVYLAMRLCHMADIEEFPLDLSSLSANDLIEYLQETSRQIVDELWSLPSVDDVQSVLDSEYNYDSDDDDDDQTYEWCTCKEGRTISNSSLLRTVWQIIRLMYWLLTQ